MITKHDIYRCPQQATRIVADIFWYQMKRQYTLMEAAWDLGVGSRRFKPILISQQKIFMSPVLFKITNLTGKANLKAYSFCIKYKIHMYIEELVRPSQIAI